MRRRDLFYFFGLELGFNSRTLRQCKNELFEWREVWLKTDDRLSLKGSEAPSLPSAKLSQGIVGIRSGEKGTRDDRCLPDYINPSLLFQSQGISQPYFHILSA